MNLNTCHYHPEQIAAFIAHEVKREEYYSFDSEPTGAHHGYMLLATSCGRRRVAPVLCSDPFCVSCEKVKAAERRRRWLPVLRSMRDPKFITLTIPTGPDLQERFDTLKESFRAFMGLRLGPRNRNKLHAAAIGFVEKHYSDKAAAGDIQPENVSRIVDSWNISLNRFWPGIDTYKRKNEKWPMIRNIIGKGFAVLEITRSNNLWHVHRHLTVDSRFIPWPLLCAAWLQVTDNQASIIDIHSVGHTDKDIKELIKYLSKSWDIPEELHDDFRKTVKGLKRVWPLGHARPVDEREPCPYCGKAECKSHVSGTAVLIRTGSLWGHDYKLFETDDSAHRWIIMLRDPEDRRWRDVPLLDTLRICASFANRQTGPPVATMPV